MANERIDMFDVAEGKFELVEFLLTRFSELDLQTKIAIDPKAGLEEQYAPPPKPPDPPPPPLFPEVAFPSAEEVGAAPATEAAAEEPKTQDSADIERMIASFHQAAKVYTELSRWEDSENPEGDPAAGEEPPA